MLSALEPTANQNLLRRLTDCADEQHIPLPDQETPAAPDPAADIDPSTPDIEQDRLLAVVAAAADFYRSQTHGPGCPATSPAAAWAR